MTLAQRLWSNISICVVLVLCLSPQSFCSEDRDAGPHDRSGHFEVTVKTSQGAKINIEDLAVDRDQDERLNSFNASSPPKKFLYRVRQEGFLGFDQEAWVDKMRFELFNTPAIQRSEYRSLAQLLEEIATSIRQSKEVLHDYYQYGMRMINFCDPPVFTSLHQLDAAITAQREQYRKLEALRDNVAASLRELTEDRDCKEVLEDYKRQLTAASQNLSQLTGKYGSFRQRYESLKRPEAGPAESPTGTRDIYDTRPSPSERPTRR